MASNTSRFRRPVRFNRTRANPMQRLPFYRQSHAKVGDHWRMPEVDGYLMGREVGRVCAIAFVQALADAASRPDMAASVQLSDTVASAVEAYGGAMTESQRGLVDGFFGRGSKLIDVLKAGLKVSDKLPKFDMEQIEAALTGLSSMTLEDYAIHRIGSISGVIPESQSHPDFSLS